MSKAIEAATKAMFHAYGSVTWEEMTEQDKAEWLDLSEIGISAALPHLTEGLPAVIDDAQQRWKTAGRHEPLTVAIARAVTGHLERRITDAG